MNYMVKMLETGIKNSSWEVTAAIQTEICKLIISEMNIKVHYKKELILWLINSVKKDLQDYELSVEIRELRCRKGKILTLNLKRKSTKIKVIY